MPREAKVPIPHSMWVEDLIYIYICSHLISPCCSTCWSVFFRFSISSPGDFISFPHLFDHFIKGLISFPNLFDQFITQKKNIVHTYLFILSFGFISGSKFSQSISPVDHYSFSSVLQSFPNLLVHVVIWFHQFFPPISGKYGKIHNFSWENMDVDVILMSFCGFIFLF